jgi:FkbM family methyltransferase
MKRPMLSEAAILRIRRATMAAKRIPGSRLLLEYVRKAFSGDSRLISVSDFDNELEMVLRLDEHMQSQIFWYGYYSRDIVLLLNRILRPGMVVIDVGANIGEISLAAARRVGRTGRVYSFEPMASLYARLEEHTRVNGLRQITLVQKGLSDKQGTATLFRASELFEDGTSHDGLGTLYPTSKRATAVSEIEVTTLDQFSIDAGVDRLDLIKIDVEGAELAVLKGGVKTMRDLQPSIILELQSDTSENAGYSPREILTLLESLGYSFHIIGRQAKMLPLNAARLAAFQNIICIPESTETP